MDHLLRMMKALANETRKQIIELLVIEKQLPLSEIATRINRPYKTVAGHLKNLERAGLLKTLRWKGEVLYSLNRAINMYYNRQLIALIKRHMAER
jgi:predicted transcriptional regulator